MNRSLRDKADIMIYTGMIDEYYGYCYGALEYRSLFFQEKFLDQESFQGNAVVNYTDKDVPYTRIIEHKHFEFENHSQTIIFIEYPCNWSKTSEPYYPINTTDNNNTYKNYLMLSKRDKGVYFAGRLGAYQYNDMDKTVSDALNLYNTLTHGIL